MKENASPDEKLAGESGLRLATELRTKLMEDLSTGQLGKEESTFTQTLKEGYQEMCKNRRSGYFHSFLRAISSFLKAIVTCFASQYALLLISGLVVLNGDCNANA